MDNSYFELIKQLLTENNIPQIDKQDITNMKKIGEGSQSTVYKCEYKGKVTAIKVMSEIDIKCIIHEIAIIVKLECENIPQFYGVVLDNKTISYVTQFISGKSLDEVDFTKLTFDYKLQVAKEISKTIAYMHKLGCIHRDLKAENIMIDTQSGKVYVIDFGIAKLLDGKTAIITRAKGTMHYLAPEILDVTSLNENKQIVSAVTQAVDVWAFSCLVSYIFSGFPPWCDKYKDTPETIQKLLTKKIIFPVPNNIDNSKIVEIIKLGTVIDYKKRKTMIELDGMLQKI